jgi:hypothetical protein
MENGRDLLHHEDTHQAPPGMWGPLISETKRSLTLPVSSWAAAAPSRRSRRTPGRMTRLGAARAIELFPRS